MPSGQVTSCSFNFFTAFHGTELDSEQTSFISWNFHFLVTCSTLSWPTVSCLEREREGNLEHVNHRYTYKWIISSYTIGLVVVDAINCTVTELPVIDEQRAKVVLEGRTSEVVCSASGRPVPDITWRRTSNTDDYVAGIQPVRYHVCLPTALYQWSWLYCSLRHMLHACCILRWLTFYHFILKSMSQKLFNSYLELMC